MNFQLPAVLISIFIFSHVEAEFRKELSLVLDSDVGISKNRERVFYNSVFEVPVKLFFLVLNMAQLAYLGVTFDLDPSQVLKSIKVVWCTFLFRFLTFIKCIKSTIETFIQFRNLIVHTIHLFKVAHKEQLIFFNWFHFINLLIEIIGFTNEMVFVITKLQVVKPRPQAETSDL